MSPPLQHSVVVMDGEQLSTSGILKIANMVRRVGGESLQKLANERLSFLQKTLLTGTDVLLRVLTQKKSK